LTEISRTSGRAINMSEGAVSFDALLTDDGRIEVPESELGRVLSMQEARGRKVHVSITAADAKPLRSSRGRLKHLASSLGGLDIDAARAELTAEADKSLAKWDQ
jgi:hypothetical protein